MPFDRALFEHKFLGDFGVTASSRHLHQDVKLAWGELGKPGIAFERRGVGNESS